MKPTPSTKIRHILQWQSLQCKFSVSDLNKSNNGSVLQNWAALWASVFLKILWYVMNYSQSFLILKGDSATSISLGQTGICQFISLNFHIIPDQLPWCSPRPKDAGMTGWLDGLNILYSINTPYSQQNLIASLTSVWLLLPFLIIAKDKGVHGEHSAFE